MESGPLHFLQAVLVPGPQRFRDARGPREGAPSAGAPPGLLAEGREMVTRAAAWLHIAHLGGFRRITTEMARVRVIELTTVLLLALAASARSEEHTSELQSPVHLVCRLLLEKKKVN